MIYFKRFQTHLLISYTVNRLCKYTVPLQNLHILFGILFFHALPSGFKVLKPISKLFLDVGIRHWLNAQFGCQYNGNAMTRKLQQANKGAILIIYLYLIVSHLECCTTLLQKHFSSWMYENCLVRKMFLDNVSKNVKVGTDIGNM